MLERKERKEKKRNGENERGRKEWERRKEKKG